MNILYTLHSGNPGGMEQHVLDLVRSMIEKGHKVYVRCLDGPIVDWYKKAGAVVSTSQIKFEIDPFYIWGLIKLLRNEKIDVLHSHELKASGNSLIAGFLAGTKIRISHIHTPISEWRIPGFIKYLYTKITIFCYAMEVRLLASAEIALTESRKQVKVTEGIPESKLVVIPNTLAISKFDVTSDQERSFREEIFQRFSIPDGSYVFGNVSRMTEEKGHSVLLKAFKKLLEYSIEGKENIYLLLAGGGALEEDLKKQAVELGISDKVRFSGVFAAEDLVKFYKTFDSFIFPSLAEGFGIVLIEAMYNALPIISSDLEVLQEVGGSTIILFETGNSDDLAQKMLNIYQKKDRIEELRQSAKQRVLELFCMQKFAETYENLYFSLMENKLR